MNLLQDEYREYLRQQVIDAHRNAEECARARLQYYDNPFLKEAMEKAIQKAAKLHSRFLARYGEQPMLPVSVEGF